MMAFDTFKELKKGDRVKFENVSDPVYGNVSGEGAAIGFPKFGNTDVLCIDADGKNYPLPYEKLKKIYHRLECITRSQ